MATESRLVEFRDMEVKGRDFRGIAAVYDTPWGDKLTQAVGYVETISRGAFRTALGLGENIPLLGAHRRHELLATTEAQTLTVEDTPDGLEVAANLPKNYLGDYYREMIHRGDIKGMSYGMETLAEDSIWTKGQGGRQHRSIANVRRLLDVTLTWEPAYPATVAELRAAGLVVAPLEEIAGGLEGPPAEAPAEQPPDVDASQLSKRLVELRIRELEQGGMFP
jgi:HK97 family phage prohead protease